jgi:hypothetical protein
VLGSFDTTVCCASANKRLKPPATLIQQGESRLAPEFSSTIRIRTDSRKPQSGDPLASGTYLPPHRLASTHLKILGKQ